MPSAHDIGLYTFLRNRFVLAGLLILGVGVADVVAGRSKLSEYRLVLATTPAPARANPAALFPEASEEAQEHAVARAKLGFYELLVLSGQALIALGGILLATGAAQVRRRVPRGRPYPVPLR